MLVGLMLLGLVAGCGRPKVEMPEDPAPPPKEAPSSVLGDEPVDSS